MSDACRVVAKFGQTEATGTFFIWIEQSISDWEETS